MQPDDPSKRELTTWSEIASYLGVTERTAQTWRRARGLPVRRLGGRATTTVAELERWKRDAQQTPRESRPARRFIPVAAVVAVVMLAGGWVWMGARRTARLVRFEQHGNVLAVFDEHGRRAWTHEFAAPLENPPGPSSAGGLLADIDGDGRPELIYVPWRRSLSESVQCFREDGSLAWEHALGKTITDARGQTIPPPYLAKDVAVLRKPRPDGGRIVILSHHLFSWPARVDVLTPEGRQVAAYWHPGWLVDLEVHDLDGDGKEELILGGVNNSFLDRAEGATLVVLDSDFSTGQGPFHEGDPRQVRGIPAGEQLAVLLFPDFPRPKPAPGRVTLVHEASWMGGFLELRLVDDPFGFAHYQLDRRLRIVNIAPSSEWLHSVAPKATADQRRELAWKLFGRVKVLKNAFQHP